MAQQTPPTPGQLARLQKLGYSGPPPLRYGDATLLAKWLKSGLTSEQAASQLQAHRQAQQDAFDAAEERRQASERERIANIRKYINRLQKEARRDPDNRVVGFKFTSEVDPDLEPGQRMYRGAFLPIEVAEKHPELLIILDDEELYVGDRIPKKVVTAPGVIIDRTAAKSRTIKSPPSSFSKLVRYAVLGFLIYALYKLFS